MLFPSVNRQKGWLFFVLIVLISLNLYFHFSFEGALADRARWLDGLFGNLIRPVQHLTSFTQERLVAGGSYFSRLSGAMEENERLKALIGSQELRLQRFEELEYENIRLRELLSFQETGRLEFMPAKVIAQDLSLYFRTLVINRGSRDGVKKAMPVLSAQGIVGRVFRTNLKHSTVLLVTDVNSRVDARVQRSRARAIVGGSPSGDLNLRFFPRRQDLKEGDVLVSTGLAGIFPAGYKLGFVQKITKDPHFVLDEVELQPAVDFNTLEEVLIVTSEPEYPRENTEG